MRTANSVYVIKENSTNEWRPMVGYGRIVGKRVPLEVSKLAASLREITANIFKV
ncbi:hypothetical protein C8J35_1461 [Rhizobium sp. PP-F2F-G38]|nr:hypothetical protein C8J35_1461 [Rhizobium sp. PP-F2F-G38]